MKSLFESIAAIVGATTFILLALSITHEYGYFYTIGPHFQTFLSTSDYFSNAILWLPLMFIVFGWVDWNQLREDREPKKRVLRQWRTWIWPAIGVLWLLFLTINERWPPDWGYLACVLIMFFFLWSTVWRNVVALLPPAEDDFIKIGRLAIRLGLPLLAAVFVLGWYNASNDLKRYNDPYVVRLKGSDERQLRIVLRNFDKGVLMKNTLENRVEFRRWEDIAAIEKPIASRSRSFACSAFDWCLKSETGPVP
jgi:hypothetical protein